MGKHARLAAASAVLALMLTFGGMAGAEALQGEHGFAQGAITVPAGEVREGDVRVGQGNVTVDGVLRGSVRVGQGNVEVRGETRAVRVSQGRVKVVGKVDGDVEVALGRVEVDGEVDGDVEVASGMVILAPTARVRGRVAVDNGRVERAEGAVVEGGVESGGGAGGVVRFGPIRIEGDVVEGPGFRVGPDGVFFPGGSITPRGVEIGGRFPHRMGGPWGWPWEWIPFDGLDARRAFWSFGPLAGLLNPFWHLFQWAGLFLLAAVTLAAIPQPIGRMAAALGEQPLRLGGIGLLVLLLTPVALLLLIVTLIGIPLVPLALLGLVAAKFVGYVALSAFVGDRLAALVPALEGNHGKAFWRLLAGTLTLALAGGVPFIGWVVGLIGAALGLGVVVATRFGTGSSWPGKTPPPEHA